MRPICWLHISDLHLHVGNEWSQDVVLQEMCRDIERKRESGMKADFILISGDIAFSGKAKEYDRAKEFLAKLQSHSGVPTERIFCVPGNHDIDRSRQRNAFVGALHRLQTLSDINELLCDSEELTTLLVRQENYRNFQESYFSTQCKVWTSEGLAYISKLTIGDVVFAIVGLNSAWLSEGGESDHGKLLIGERQAIGAISIALDDGDSPDVVIAMAHHPFRLLQEFDRLPVQHRIERSVQFFHHGHLHQAEARMGGPNGSQCLTVAAGAAYAGREYDNSYYFVTLNPLESTRSTQFYQYYSTLGTYSLSGEEERYSIDFAPRETCNMLALAEAMTAYNPILNPFAYYIAALILGHKSEFPIPVQDGYTFGSIEATKILNADDLSAKSAGLANFRNILHIHYGRKTLEEILDTYGDIIIEYGTALNAACGPDPSLLSRLTERDQDARKMAGSRPSPESSYTLSLLEELKDSGDWSELREQAGRHMESPHLSIATTAKRMYALALASTGDLDDKAKAIDIYKFLVNSGSQDSLDFINLAFLLMNAGNMDEAVQVVIEGFRLFQDNKRLFHDVGNQIVAATGDRTLRERFDEMTRG